MYPNQVFGYVAEFYLHIEMKRKGCIILFKAIFSNNLKSECLIGLKNLP